MCILNDTCGMTADERNIDEHKPYFTRHRACCVSCIPSVMRPGNLISFRRRGLFIIDLESPFSIPRFLPQGGTWDVADVQWNPHTSHAQYIVSTSSEKLYVSHRCVSDLLTFMPKVDMESSTWGKDFDSTHSQGPLSRYHRYKLAHHRVRYCC
jgi:hypothetical protein